MTPEIEKVLSALSTVIHGKPEQVKLALCCLLTKGHLLIEDLPGMGKTTLSHGLANILGLQYQRVQFTSDLLPSDITGTSVFNVNAHSFDFHPGPIFSQVLLADEINRASPKTQSALLEAMEEKQVSIDGNTYPLPTPFFVIATQNPSYQSGTHPLPESQLDRFTMRISLGYPDEGVEKSLIKQDSLDSPQKQVNSEIEIERLLILQNQITNTVLSDSVINYIIDIVKFTRNSGQFSEPLSPRASMAIGRTARAYAFISGRDYTTHDDIIAVLPAVIGHRLNFAVHSQKQAITNLLEQVPVRL